MFVCRGGVSFITHDGGTYVFRDSEKYKDVNAFGSIHIGERTFIGYKVTIMPGVTIGKRCVIGAGAVVTRNIPDFSVAVGVPAKVISTLDEYTEKMYAKSCELYVSEKMKQDKRLYLESLANAGKI